MKWVNLKKNTFKKRAKNNRNRRKFFNELKQSDTYAYEYVQTENQEVKREHNN
jgi:hypothetical protein